MSGKIRIIIDKIIKKKSNGNPALENLNKTKLILKGINVDLYDENSKDDYEVISILENIANINNIDLSDILFKEHFVTTCSTNKNIEKSVLEIKEELSQVESNLILYFCTSDYDAKSISEKMKQAFPGAVTLGCTGNALYSTGKNITNGIVVTALSSDLIEDYKFEIIDYNDDTCYVEVFKSFDEYFSVDNGNYDPDKYIGVSILDWNPDYNEDFMDKVGEYSNILFAGGTAGGEKIERQYTKIYADGKPFKDVGLLLILKSRYKFEVFKTQSFEPTGYKLVPTKISSDNKKIVEEFNNQPAAKEFAQAININKSALNNEFVNHHIGLDVDGEMYTYVGDKVLDKDKILFYSGLIHENFHYEALKYADIVNDLVAVFKAKNINRNNTLGVLNFDCLGRSIRLNKENKYDEYIKAFQEIPLAGIVSFGEEYICHNNGTMVLIVFKKDLL